MSNRSRKRKKRPATTPRRISLAPLTLEQALSAALQVKKPDVQKLEAKEMAKIKRAKLKKRNK